MKNADQTQKVSSNHSLKWWDAVIPLVIFILTQILSVIIAYIFLIIYRISTDTAITIKTLKTMNIEKIMLFFSTGKNASSFLSWAVFISFVFSLLFILLYKKFRKINALAIGLKTFPARFFYVIILCNIGLFTASFFYNMLLSFARLSTGQADNFLNTFGRDKLGLILLGITIVLLAPVIEEIIFRGFLFNYLDSRFGFAIGATVSAIIFAIGHFMILGFPIIFLMGFVFAYLTKRFNSIWPSIIAHFFNNAAAFVLLYLSIR